MKYLIYYTNNDLITQASLYAEEASNVHDRCAYCMGQHILLMGVLSVRTPLFLEDENFFSKIGSRGCTSKWIKITSTTTPADF